MVTPAEAIHARLVPILDRYHALTSEELVAMRKGLTENYVYTIVDVTPEGIAQHERAMDGLTAILTIVRERGDE